MQWLHASLRYSSLALSLGLIHLRLNSLPVSEDSSALHVLPFSEEAFGSVKAVILPN